MRSQLWSYYPPSAADFSQIGADAIVAIDSSALLHSYRLAPNTADAWIDFLEALDDRVWVPFQAALEYQRNRLGVVSSELSLLSRVESTASSSLDKLLQALRKEERAINRSRTLSWSSLEAAVDKARQGFASIAGESREGAVDIADAARASDAIHVRITRILEGRVGSAPSDADVKQRIDAGKERYQKEIPPGFADADKGGVEQFGDLFVWLELLEHAEGLDRPAVLITQDEKGDWWRQQSGHVMGPLPALREEFAARVSKPFWLYTVASVMRAAETFGVEQIQPEAVSDAEQLELESQMDAGDRVRDRSDRRLKGLVDLLEELSDPDVVSDDVRRDGLVRMITGLIDDELQEPDGESAAD
jgi:hypothetical protein